MKSQAGRKGHRFFIINPVTDRRREPRFESRDEVVARIMESNKSLPGTAFDTGQRGLQLELGAMVHLDTNIEILFPNSPDQIQCFGRVVWIKPGSKKGLYRCGLMVNAWFGIVEGPKSWRQLKGYKMKKDRRLHTR